MKTLQISEALELPLEAVTQKIAFLARSGAGKTYGACKLAEEMLGAGAHVVAIDPVGVWYGLRLAPDGKSGGIPIPVLGGLHGDLPLEAAAGALVADLVVDRDLSAVLDVSMMRKADRKRFATDFAERLFERKKSSRSPLHVFLEEAQTFAPQRVAPDEARMLGAFEDLVKLGRNFGVGVTLVSQRPQAINKDVLNQTEVLFALQTNGAQERKALEAWIVEQGLDVKNLVADLPSLPIGTAWLWSPQWLRVTKKIRIGKRRTFDASATPTVGSKRIEPRSLSPIDLEAVRSSMKAVVEAAAENDPKRLKARIRELEAAAAKREVERVEVPVLSAEDRERLTEALAAAMRITARLEAVAPRPAGTFSTVSTPYLSRVDRRARPTTVTVPAKSRAVTEAAGPPPGTVAPYLQDILDALARLLALGVERADLRHVAALAGKSPRSSTFAEAVAKLRASEFIERRDGALSLTAGGLIAANPVDVPASFDELVRCFRAHVLDEYQGRLLEVLVKANDEDRELSRGELAGLAGVSATSSTFAEALSKMRALGVLEYGREGVRLALSLNGRAVK
jgi:hypothetical protein